MRYGLRKFKDKASSIWRNLNFGIGKIRKFKFFTSLVVVLSFIFGVVVRPYISETVRLLVQKRFSAKQLSYEVSSISRHRKYELFNLANAEGLDAFDLKLDDPILTDYYLIKVRLRNDGEAIKGSLKFNVSIGKNYTKILDINRKVIRPANKSLKIVHSLPPLTWDITEGNQSTTLTWDAEIDGVAGFHVYRSVVENVGYGRINDRMLTQPKSEFPSDSFSRCYYRITAIGVNGMESEPTNPIRFPDIIAFDYCFKDVYWIDPQVISGKTTDGSKKFPFSSLSEAIDRKGKSATFIIKQSREKVTSIQNISTDAIAFYKNELDFLKGQVEVSLLNGIDEHAEIELLFLCKTIPGKQIDLNLELEGAPEIKFGRRGRRWLGNIPLKDESVIPTPPKVLLTPKEVKTYLGEGTIYLVWEKPKSSAYKGVRIFRSTKRNADDLTNVGEELYDGPGSVEKLCRTVYFKKSIGSLRIRDKVFPDISPYDSRPPPRDSSEVPPSPPTFLAIATELGLDDNLLHFADKAISPDMAYTYTLWAYGNNDTYSYPIIINASLGDWSPRDNCYPKVR